VSLVVAGFGIAGWIRHFGGRGDRAVFCGDAIGFNFAVFARGVSRSPKPSLGLGEGGGCTEHRHRQQEGGAEELGGCHWGVDWATTLPVKPPNRCSRLEFPAKADQVDRTDHPRLWLHRHCRLKAGHAIRLRQCKAD